MHMAVYVCVKFRRHVLKAASFNDTELLEILASSGGNLDFKDKVSQDRFH